MVVQYYNKENNMLDRKEQTIKLIFRIIMIFAIIGVIFIVLLVI